MAEKSLTDTKVFERSESDHGDDVDVDRDHEDEDVDVQRSPDRDPETGDHTGQNGIDIICQKDADNTTQLYGVKNYESLGKS